MEYKIVWSIKAAGQTKSLDRSVAKRIHEKVEQLYKNPERFVEKLFRYPYYWLKVGDYRVIPEIKQESVRILILKVRHISKIYERK